MIRLCLLSFLIASGARGDTVELKTGERLEGTFRQAGAAGVVVEVAGQAITIQLEKVQAIYLGAAKPTAVAGPAPYQEALDAVKSLRSVTESGVSYRDYAPRVLDAKVKVDRYLSANPDGHDGPREPRNAIALAMREYQLAAQAWNTAMSHDTEVEAIVGNTLDKDPEISKCASARVIVIHGEALYSDSLMWDKNIASNPDVARIHRLRSIGSEAARSQPLLWSCASAQVAEAERLLGQH